MLGYHKQSRREKEDERHLVTRGRERLRSYRRTTQASANVTCEARHEATGCKARNMICTESREARTAVFGQPQLRRFGSHTAGELESPEGNVPSLQDDE